MDQQDEFERLVSEAVRQDFSGWDFSYIDERWRTSPTSWDYRQRILGRVSQAASLLDMGTGGGEFLASLVPLPVDTCATECYPPNVPIARERLEPLGVQVIEPKNEEDLPFEDARFDLVINRHESFSASQVYRVLKPGGLFITQQVGGRDNIRLNALLGAGVALDYSDWGLESAVQELEAAGFQVVEQCEEFPETVLSDIGAVVYYLRAIPWQITDFGVDAYRSELRALHNLIQETGELHISSHRFHIEARRGPEEISGWMQSPAPKSP